jgi:uncharacterized Zn finger protein
MYPSIDLTSARTLADEAACCRGAAYAWDEHVLSCLWDPDSRKLFGTVRGSEHRVYYTTVQLSRVGPNKWIAQSGSCDCPVRVNCKHVVAVMVGCADGGGGGDAFGSALTADDIRGLLA